MKNRSARLGGVVALGVALALAACGGSAPPANGAGNAGNGSTGNTPVDLSCDRAVYPSAQWTQCEAQNYAMVLQAPLEQVGDPAFVLRWIEQSTANAADYLARDAADPSWLLASSSPLTELIAALGDPASIAAAIQKTVAGIEQNPASAVSVSLDTPLTPLCASWSLQCAGDPFRYPATDPFYATVGEVTPVVFYDSGCARLSGRVWRPLAVPPDARLPGVVIDNGSIEAPEPLYWWAAQLLVRNGYVVLTFDPRGQGRSDFQTPSGAQGSNENVSVFWTGLVDAIDFFRSTPEHPYPNNLACAGTYPTVVAPYNPYYASVDPERLGIAGHSAGAEGVSIVQGYGAPGADPWPGKLDRDNPVKVAVAWDGLVAPSGQGLGGAAGNLPLPAGALGAVPKFGIRVPAMDEDSEYGLAPVAFLQPPDPEAHKAAYAAWKAAEIPVFAFTVRGSTHYEWSLIPSFPATSWCPGVQNGQCLGGFGNAMAQHYTLAWFDRWLKKPGEPGYADADARLLDNDGAQGRTKMSWHFYSAYHFPTRDGRLAHCENVRAGC
jgi:hypothetical protein